MRILVFNLNHLLILNAVYKPKRKSNKRFRPNVRLSLRNGDHGKLKRRLTSPLKSPWISTTTTLTFEVARLNQAVKPTNSPAPSVATATGARLPSPTCTLATTILTPTGTSTPAPNTTVPSTAAS